MKLINGPYNDRVIDDAGTAIIRMCIYNGGQVIGAEIGEAIYEPDESRDLAFWLENHWLGTLEGTIEA